MAAVEDFKETINQINSFLSRDEVREWGYDYDGMMYINLEFAMYLFSKGGETGVAVYRLYYDNTEGMVLEKEEFLDYAITGDNIFGMESDDWERFIGEEENRQLIRDYIPLQGAWDSFIGYLEKYNGMIDINAKEFQPIKDKLNKIGFEDKNIMGAIEDYQETISPRIAAIDHRRELGIIYKYETLHNVADSSRLTKWHIETGLPVTKKIFPDESISKRAAEILDEISLDDLNRQWDEFVPKRRKSLNDYISKSIRKIITQARADIEGNTSHSRWYCRLVDSKGADTYISLEVLQSANKATINFTAEFIIRDVKTYEVKVPDIPIGDFATAITIKSICQRVITYGPKIEEYSHPICISNDIKSADDYLVLPYSDVSEEMPDTRQFDIHHSKNYTKTISYNRIMYKENKVIIGGGEYNIVDEWLRGDDIFMLLEYYITDWFEAYPTAPYFAVVNGSPFIYGFDKLPDRGEMESKYDKYLGEEYTDFFEAQGRDAITGETTPSKRKQLEHYLNALNNAEQNGEYTVYPYLKKMDYYFPHITRARIMDILMYGRRLKAEDITNIRYLDNDNPAVADDKFAADIHGMPDIITFRRGEDITDTEISSDETNLYWRLTEPEKESLSSALIVEMIFDDVRKQHPDGINPPTAKETVDDISPTQGELAKGFVEAIKKMAQSEESLENFESYLSDHFSSWLEKYASTPEGLTHEMQSFAKIGTKEEAKETKPAVSTGRKL